MGHGGGRSNLATLSASGHLLTRIELKYENNLTEPLGVHLDEPTLWAGISSLPTGAYQMCVCVKPKPETGVRAFNATGIGLNIQNDVEAMWVNYLNPNLGIRVNVPRTVGNRIGGNSQKSTL